jgi:hypothetical protein
MRVTCLYHGGMMTRFLRNRSAMFRELFEDNALWNSKGGEQIILRRVHQAPAKRQPAKVWIASTSILLRRIPAQTVLLSPRVLRASARGKCFAANQTF